MSIDFTIPDEARQVHRWITGKTVIRAYKKDGTTAAAAGGDLLSRRAGFQV